MKITTLTLAAALLLLLAACSGGRHELMQQQLAQLQAMNQADSVLTDDSLAQTLADYFDLHGTPNEQMEAHYLLGRTHADRGETPRAIDCYHDAIACADTTAADCDFWMMASVYGQMATLYHQQLLLSFEIEAHLKASQYNYMAHDTLHALNEQKMIAGAYILLNKKDSAEMILKDVICQYRRRNKEQKALQASTMIMHLLIDSPERQTELKRLIDIYDAKCSLFDEKHELPPSACLFNYYKGKYYENVGKLDSADYYYRKSYIPGRNSTAQEGSFKGLLSVYSKLNQPDSIAKYARLYCEINDSTVFRKDQAITAQMAASYNYNHYQKEAQKNERKAHQTELLLITLGIVLCIVVSAGIYAARLYKRRQLKKRKTLEEKQRKKVEQLREAYRQELARQESLFQQKEGERIRMDDIYHKVTEAIRKELDSAKSESRNMRENYFKARQTIEEIKKHYEKDKTALNEEILTLKSRIAELKKREVLSDNRKFAKQLHATDIAASLKSRAELPTHPMTEKEFEILQDAFIQFFPLLMQDIKLCKNISKTDEKVVLLTALGLKPGQIQRLIDKSPSQITNSKTKANKILFADSSASRLNHNLVLRYGI